MNEDYVYFNWDMNNFAAPLMSSGLYYWSDLATSDSSHVDCTSLYGFEARDFISVNCYGDGSNRYFNLEAASGNAPQATVPYYVATGIPASVSGGTITFTGSFIASRWPTGEIIETGQCNGGNGIDLAQFTVTSAGSTAITANAGSASGTATGCTIAPWNWLQEVYTSAAGNIPVSGSVSGSTVSFSGRFTCSQWPVGTPFSISNASGGTTIISEPLSSHIVQFFDHHSIEYRRDLQRPIVHTNQRDSIRFDDGRNTHGPTCCDYL